MFTTVGTPVELNDLRGVTKDKGRVYKIREENEKQIWYPSVTTVTGVRKKDSIAKWRKKVGEEEANRICNAASTRGEKFHSMVESYLKNEKVEFTNAAKSVLAEMLFRSAKKDIHRIDNIHCIEAPLYSDTLRLAGRVDCIAEFDGELAVIDFKTSTRAKKFEWIENYLVQETAYAVMYYERCGIQVKKIVTLVAVEDGQVQVFEEYDLEKYYNLLLEYIDEYMESIK